MCADYTMPAESSLFGFLSISKAVNTWFRVVLANLLNISTNPILGYGYLKLRRDNEQAGVNQ